MSSSRDADERALAAHLFNEVWSLLDRTDRTPEDDDRMVHMAHASRHHWETVGGDQERAIGEWQVARVYAALGRGEPAVHHALRCVDLAARPGVEAWLAASAQEGLARSLLAAGRDAEALAARDAAVALLARVEDVEDRDVVQADLDTLPL